MSFFSTLFRTSRNESVVLIHIAADSVAGAYVRYTGNDLPTILYSHREPIGHSDSGSAEPAMLRTLEVVATTLERDGTPALVRAAGSHAVTQVFVSIDAPWQETLVRSEQVTQEKDFVFTKRLVADTLQKATTVSSGRSPVEVAIVGTVLNGYETKDPYGKRVRHASIIILTSYTSQQVSDTVHSILQSLFHTKAIILSSGSSSRYQGIHAAFPHEGDGLVVDTIGSVPSSMLIRGNLLVATSEMRKDTAGAATIDPSGEEFRRAFGEIAKNFPLPRIVFLIARDEEMELMKKKLEAMKAGTLWLSENPLRIIPILTKTLAGLVRQGATMSTDLSLLLIALQYQHRSQGVSK